MCHCHTANHTITGMLTYHSGTICVCSPLVYLQSDVPLIMSGGTCTELIDGSVPQLKLRMSPLRVAAVLAHNKRRGMQYAIAIALIILYSTRTMSLTFQLGNVFSSFPVVSDSGHLHGMVSQLVLEKALANKRGRGRKSSHFAEVVMLVINAQREQKTTKASSGRGSTDSISRMESIRTIWTPTKKKAPRRRPSERPSP
jgi:hypothetical protein